MGFGFPAAIGTAIALKPKASPASQVVCIAGDGSLQMNIQEMSTALAHNLPIKILLINNSCLGMVHQFQELFYDKRYSQTELSDNPDFAGLAEAYGWQASRITDPAQVSGEISKMLNAPSPYLLEIVVGRERNVYPMVAPNASLEEGIKGPNTQPPNNNNAHDSLASRSTSPTSTSVASPANPVGSARLKNLESPANPVGSARLENFEIHENPARPTRPESLENPARPVRPDNPADSASPETRHVLAVTVENISGVLSRVASLISRRGFNVESLSVGPTQDPKKSRITVVVWANNRGFEQITKQLNKLVSVYKVTDLTGDGAIERELVLIKVNADAKQRSEIMQVANIFRANIVDVSPTTLTIEATGNENKVHGLEDLLRPYGITEMVRTGKIALGRNVKS